MAPRVSSPYWLRAEGVVTPWATILRRRIAQLGRTTQLDPRLIEAQLAAVQRRPTTVQLRWACAEALGVPLAPFQVWVRARGWKLERVTPTVLRGRLTWGFVSSTVQVTCTVADGNRPVALYLLRGGSTLREVVGAAAVRGAAGSSVTLVARCGGATRAILVNGNNPAFQVDRLDDVINDQAWRPLELVGLPADDPWAGTAYRAGKQGMMAALTDPVTAARQRLERGGPPIGWYPITEGGRVAPAWVPPDVDKLIGEVRGDLLPNVARLFRPGVLPTQQAQIVDAPPVQGPRSGGRTSSLAAKATLPPLALLTLPASSEPFLALATGFGTAYTPEQLKVEAPPGTVGGATPDFLVTADYPGLPDGRGPATVAAFVPGGIEHGAMAPPTSLTSERAGIVAPELRDRPWRETVRVSWDRLPVTVALGRASGAVVARYDVPGSTQAVCLQEVRAAGDRRPLIPVPDGAEGTPGFARSAMVDAAAEIPIGSGGRRCGYAVAVQDVFGVWSRWEDVGLRGERAAPAAAARARAARRHAVRREQQRARRAAGRAERRLGRAHAGPAGAAGRVLPDGRRIRPTAARRGRGRTAAAGRLPARRGAAVHR
jgi:hypothetical protein